MNNNQRIITIYYLDVAELSPFELENITSVLSELLAILDIIVHIKIKNHL